MLAFHGDKATKAKYVARLKAHDAAAADAARQQAFKRQADKIIELLAEAPISAAGSSKAKRAA